MLWKSYEISLFVFLYTPSPPQDQLLESANIGQRIAEYRQQKAAVNIISLEECQDRWGEGIAPLTASQGQTVWASYVIGALRSILWGFVINTLIYKIAIYL